MFYVYNGKILNKYDKAKVNPYIDGIMYGYGLFETIKVTDQEPILLDEHLNRLRDGLEYFDITLVYSDQQIKAMVEQLIEANNFDGALKLVVIKNNNISNLIILMNQKQYTPQEYDRGFNLLPSQVKKSSTSNVIRYKTLNYLENLLEFKAAQRNGYDEVLFFNEKNHITEGAISNIFLVKDNIVYTPDVDSGLLNGIMRQEVIRVLEALGVDSRVQPIDQEFINGCEEIFITNALMELMPVNKIKSFQYEPKNRVIMEKVRKYLYMKGDDIG